MQVRLKTNVGRLIKPSEAERKCRCERCLRLLWAAGRAAVDLRSVRFPWSLNKAIWTEECGLGTLPVTHWTTNSVGVLIRAERERVCVSVLLCFYSSENGTCFQGSMHEGKSLFSPPSPLQRVSLGRELKEIYNFCFWCF